MQIILRISSLSSNESLISSTGATKVRQKRPVPVKLRMYSVTSYGIKAERTVIPSTLKPVLASYSSIRPSRNIYISRYQTPRPNAFPPTMLTILLPHYSTPSSSPPKPSYTIFILFLYLAQTPPHLPASHPQATTNTRQHEIGGSSRRCCRPDRIPVSS